VKRPIQLFGVMDHVQLSIFPDSNKHHPQRPSNFHFTFVLLKSFCNALKLTGLVT